MADFSPLKAAIQAAIRQNGNNEITGNIMQSILLSIVNTLGDAAINALVDAVAALSARVADGYMYGGIATPNSVPSAASGKVFYIATQAGTYTHYGSLVVEQGINIIKTNNSSWALEVVWNVDNVPTVNSGNLVTSGGIAEMYGSYIDNPEYLYALTDNEHKILFALNKDGNFFFGAGCPKQIKDYIKYLLDTKVNKENGKSLISTGVSVILSVIQDPRWMQITTDADMRILEGITTDGKKIITVEVQIDDKLLVKALEVNGTDITDNVNAVKCISLIDDAEERLEIETDATNKILSFRDKTGAKHECAGLYIHEPLGLSPDATQDLINALNELNYTANNLFDWSDSEFVEIPIPTVCAVVNIEVNSQAEAKGVDIPTHLQYWDKAGNYFRKPILLNAQGTSSLGYHVKNQAIDIADDSKIKFGNWVPCDSFHIKKYFIDVFRGQCIVGYWLTEQMYQTRPYGEKRPWDYLNSFNGVDDSNGIFSKDFATGALAHPDGFPVKVFFNGRNAGLYAFNLKKDRANYYCKKDKQNQIILDGVLGSTFWMANGDLRQAGEEGGNIWHDFEVRNPKIAKDINGNKYDGDNPTEPSNDYATTKAAIARLTTAITLVNAEPTTAAKRAKFEEFFLVPFLIDYDLIGQVIYNYDGYRKNWIWCCWDGNLWCPTSYDMDALFGMHYNGASYVSESLTQILGTYNTIPTGNNLLKGLYPTEMRARYKELRDNGIFSVDNIISLLYKWVNTCGYDNLKEDIEVIVTSPYKENGQIVVDGDGKQVLIPNTPSYRDGTKEYVYSPTTGGWYNSILRVKNWLIQRFQTLDIYYNYTNN